MSVRVNVYMGEREKKRKRERERERNWRGGQRKRIRVSERDWWTECVRPRDNLITFIPYFKQSLFLKNYGSIVKVFMAGEMGKENFKLLT